MKKINLKNTLLLILIIFILTIGLTGCTVPDITGTAKIVLTGTYYYNLKMDGTEYFNFRQPGTYFITNITPGNHTFEAIDIGGSSYGYDIKSVYISAGTTTTVYLNPTSTKPTGTVYIYVYGVYNYDIEMDGHVYFSNKPQGTYTLTNVSIGTHTFKATDTYGASFGYDSSTKYISTGSNYIYLYPTMF